MIVKSLLAKIRNKYHVHNAQADCIMDEIVRFIEQTTEAKIVGEEREIR